MLGRWVGVSARSGPRWWRWTAVALCASLAAVLINLLAGADQGPYTTSPQLGLAFSMYQLLGVGLAVWAWRHRNLDRRSRRAWGVMAVAYALLSTSGTVRMFYPAGVDFPSPADLLRLAFVPVMLIGLLALPLRTRGGWERHKVWLDSIVVVVASGMLLWYLEIGPGVQPVGRIPGGALAAALAYPALDLVLIFGASAVLFRGAAESVRGPAALLALAMLIVFAGDVYLGYRQSHLGAAAPDRWQYACWVTGHFTLTMAAFVQCRLAGRHQLRLADSSVRPASVLPYVAVGLGYLLLVLAVRGQHIRVLGLVAGAGIITGVVVLRQVVASRQNHELAITDPLTGLANRRQLYDRLRLALNRSSRNGQNVAALLIDIKGFRQVNDTMGHEAGDELLVVVGQILRRNVIGDDVVGRLGGDEFAVVLHNIDSPDNAAAVARRIVAEMRTPVMIGNTPVQPLAAIGVAMSAPGQLTAEELLEDADLAMCWAKRHTDGNVAMYQERAEGAAPLPGSHPGTTLEPNAPYTRRDHRA